LHIYLSYANLICLVGEMQIWDCGYNEPIQLYYQVYMHLLLYVRLSS